MTPILYSIYYFLLLFITYSFSILVSLTISIAISIFILLSQLNKFSYDMAVFLLLFNSMPLITENFKKNFNAKKNSIRKNLEDTKTSCDELVNEDKKQVELNLEKERRLQQISSLYEVSKDMSGCLMFDDILGIFTSALKKSFRFRCSRVILLKEPSGSIDAVYCIELGHIVNRMSPDNFDRELVHIADEIKKDIIISSHEFSQFSRRLLVIKNFDTLISIPFIVEEKVAAVLAIENIPQAHFENFIILARQFAIQFQKVVLYKSVQEMSITDSLTGLSTRRYFLERFSEEVRRSMRHKRNLSFLMLDLDHFKEKNDKFGHLVGDVILREVARILSCQLREIDIIGRYGGEEFGIVLTGIAREGAVHVAERLRKAVEAAAVKAYDEIVSSTISIGVSVFPEDGVDREDLIESADKALYKAKEKGRNMVITAQGPSS